MEEAMPTLSTLIWLGGLLHFAILIASFSVPKALDWKAQLAPLSSFMRRLVWVYGAFIVLVIVGFGALATFCAHDLANGQRLGRALCMLIATFWGARLAVQFLVFDDQPFKHSKLLRFGYHALTP